MSGSSQQSSRSPRMPKKLEKGTPAVPPCGSTNSSPRNTDNSAIEKELLVVPSLGSSSGSPNMPKKLGKERTTSPKSTSSSPGNRKTSVIEEELQNATSLGSMRSSPRLQKKFMPLMEKKEPAAAPIMRYSARILYRADEPMREELPEGPSTSSRKIGTAEPLKEILRFKKHVAGADVPSTSGGKRQARLSSDEDEPMREESPERFSPPVRKMGTVKPPKGRPKYKSDVSNPSTSGGKRKEERRERIMDIPPLQINPPSDDEEEDMPCEQMSKLRFYPESPRSPNKPSTPSPKKGRFD